MATQDGRNRHRHWVFQRNPTIWDVFGWWENGNTDLGDWTVSRYRNDVKPGDDAVFWIAGAESGVYAVGKVASELNLRPPPRPGQPGYWLKPPATEDWGCDLDMKRYLFDAPLRRADLRSDPAFADALVLRIPGGGTPQPLTDRQWGALLRHLGNKPTQATRADPARPVVTERAVGSVVESSTVATRAQEAQRTHREAKLVRAYENYLGRPLVVHSVTLPTGERLVTDAYDSATRLLIEAKASASRLDVRMALGQLLDYLGFIKPSPRLAVLLLERPSDDLIALLDRHKVCVIHATEKSFVTA